jgi:hypothetical protein
MIELIGFYEPKSIKNKNRMVELNRKFLMMIPYENTSNQDL